MGRGKYRPVWWRTLKSGVEASETHTRDFHRQRITIGGIVGRLATILTRKRDPFFK